MKILSNDYCVGGPFNTLQYAILALLIAQVTNLKPGLFTHVINNAHIYENQIIGAKRQLARYEDLLKYERQGKIILPHSGNGGEVLQRHIVVE